MEQLKEISNKSEVKINVRESAAAKRLLKKVDAMISKLDKVMDNLEKEKTIQVKNVEDKESKELVRIDEVMNAVRKVKLLKSKTFLCFYFEKNENFFKENCQYFHLINDNYCEIQFYYRCKKSQINQKWIKYQPSLSEWTMILMVI